MKPKLYYENDFEIFLGLILYITKVSRLKDYILSIKHLNCTFEFGIVCLYVFDELTTYIF